MLPRGGFLTSPPRMKEPSWTHVREACTRPLGAESIQDWYFNAFCSSSSTSERAGENFSFDIVFFFWRRCLFNKKRACPGSFVFSFLKTIRSVNLHVSRSLIYVAQVDLLP